jgi:two-component system, NtrC family, nitrogen regulation sensor histidine kinase NtrY
LERAYSLLAASYGSRRHPRATILAMRLRNSWLPTAAASYERWSLARRALMARSSLAGRVAAALIAVAAVTACAAVLAAHWLGTGVVAVLAGLLIAIPLAIWLARRIISPWSRVMLAVRDGITSLRDRDFSVSIGHASNDEIGELVTAYNSLGDVLRRERLDLHQRELLLDTVIQTTPLALVLTSAGGRVVYSNIAARQLFLKGRKLEGHDFSALLAGSPPGLRDALTGDSDTLFTMEFDGEPQVYHVSQRRFLLNAQPHRLVLLKQLTRELAAQEVAVWKKVIRVIAHELNNSLAPISSLAHSGHLLAQNPDPTQLERVFTTIEQRAAHLSTFIEGYARFAKLPQPRLAAVQWDSFFARLEGAAPFRIEGALPERAGRFDASQLEQVMINLLKNAVESGSPANEIQVAVRDAQQGFVIEVADRGSGMSDDVLRDALLPFYSTKPAGTGLGLTLCREIVDAHQGRLSLANRPRGGALVTVWLPQRLATKA